MTITSIANFPNGQIITVTIDQSTNTKSEAISTNGMLLTHIIPGATWDAASVTFEQSADGTNFYAVKDDAGATYTVTIAASQVITIPATKLIGGARSFKVVASAAQNTSSPRTIHLALRYV